MNKFIIKEIHDFASDAIGYCISDAESIDCNLSELLGMDFKTTVYSRHISGNTQVWPTSKEVKYHKFIFSKYPKPKNYINSLSWNSITIDALKKMKTYMEIEYNSQILHIGLDVTKESLEKMQNTKLFYTTSMGTLSTNLIMDCGEFPVDN